MSKQTAEGTCTLPTDKLIEKCREWNERLCESGGDDWVLQIPVNPNEDPDMIIGEVCDRLESQEQKLLNLKKEVRRLKAYGGIQNLNDKVVRQSAVLQLITQHNDEEIN